MKASRARGGFVLVITLAVLAIMIILLVALLQGSIFQQRGAENSATLTREKMLADSAVALVIGQIQVASSQSGLAWTSQPGLLRTFSPVSRQPVKCYKLYSSSALTDSSGGVDFLATDVPGDWSAHPSLYVDLNAPVRPTFLGADVYPILDPAAFTGVQGVSSDNGSATMPAMWLYELQDGTLGPASKGTKENPIVGRIAFWADDETCKININTAGVGSAWNTPRANSTDDVAWAPTAPAQGEYSRYPGHPAQTSLLPVLDWPPATTSTALLQQFLDLTPRYAWGGSQFGTKSTAAGQVVAGRADRLYGSVDELCFSPELTPTGQRVSSIITPAQLQQSRFVLTAHSVAPETTLLGEPRVAIWPVSDLPDSNHRTAADRAIAQAATLGLSSPTGPRGYYFQRHAATNPSDDFDTTTTAGAANLALFHELIARGGELIPGCNASFAQKYPHAQWPQLLLEIGDFIHGLNAIDPHPAPFIPFAPDNAALGVGHAFVVPLTTTDPASGQVLRGLGRCPTLSSLTLVIYVSGFGFDDGSVLDFEAMSDTDRNAAWRANFDLTSSTNRWKHVNSELLRTFVVPCTYQPGCAFPEVRDACDLQISGLDKLTVRSTASTTLYDFGFTATSNTPLLGNPLNVLNPDRAWGGNEGPITWRAIGDALANGSAAPYPFAGTKAFKLPVASPSYNPSAQTLVWSNPAFIVCSVPVNLTVMIRDANKNSLQTFAVPFPTFTVSAPTINQEADHFDGSTPATSISGWQTDSAHQVLPCYYMNLTNRLLATQRSRPLMVQPGDVVRGVEPGTDLRIIAALPSVPATLFTTPPKYNLSVPQSFQLRFADGTSALGSYLASTATASTKLVSTAPYSTATATTTGTDLLTGKSTALANAWFTGPGCFAPTGKTSITMTNTTQAGDWDTGPGLCPDGAMINLPDGGTSLDSQAAYESLSGGQVGAPTRFAPNALVPSPVIFGSLPAGIDPAAPAGSVPWRTLLFCPYPAAGGNHPGFAAPPDHLLLDQFWMPTVEPYAISTCFATAGKINLNDQIAPFTYLHRSTALHALLHDLRIPAIAWNQAAVYKTPGAPIDSIWNPVDEDNTIAALESRFSAGDAYLSESEICTVPLIPAGQTLSGLLAYWNNPQTAGRLTGDNLRELPYAQLYSRLTTRSNSYTVHLRVQVLKKVAADPHQDVWNEGTDLVQGDWRGSYQIERYLDPAAPAPAAASASTPGGVVGPYRFRIVSARRFSP